MFYPLFKDSTDAFLHIFTKKFLEAVKIRLIRLIYGLFLIFAEFSGRIET